MISAKEYKTMAPKPKRKKKEESIQKQLSKYIKLKFPDVIFTSESSGMRVGMGLAVKMKAQRSEGELPDMIILRPCHHWYGLMLELKTEEESPFLKKGGISTKEHIQGQLKTLKELNDQGYLALFVVGTDNGIDIINAYFSKSHANSLLFLRDQKNKLYGIG